MRQGIAAGVQTFDRFLAAAGWEPDDIDRTFCHQVGAAHRKLMFESLGLEPANDFATLETLGNTGSAALPITMALGVEQGRLRSGRSRRHARHRLGNQLPDAGRRMAEISGSQTGSWIRKNSQRHLQAELLRVQLRST